MENRKVIRYMQATQNGIIYYSPSGEKACKCSLTPSGIIEKTLIVLNPPILPNNFIKVDEIENKFSYFKVALFDILLIILASYLKNEPFFIAVSLFSLFISLKLFKLLHIIYNLKINKKYKCIAKFIAASHMATNAYFKLQRIPTLEEAKKCSKFSTESHLTYVFYVILSHLSLFTVMLLLPTIGFWPFILLACIIPLSLCHLFSAGALNFLQVFVTATPSDEELKVAIEGIKFFEVAENDIKIKWFEE